MSDQFRNEPTDPGRSLPRPTRGMTFAEIGALVFAIVWVVICIVFFFGLGGTEAGTEKNGVGFVLVVASVLVPIAVVWLAVASARSARIMTEESERLQASMSAMRKVMIEVQEFQALSGPRLADKAPRLENQTPRMPPAEKPAVFASSRPHPKAGSEPAARAEPPVMRDVSPAAQKAASPKPAGSAPAAPASPATSGDAQASLAFGTPQAKTGAVGIDDLIRAVNFPENAEDEEGFGALRRTLVDRKVATLIQAAQDVLTLLSQDGIYMDDLTPEQARPDVWRQFAAGARGRTVATLGGVTDRSSLALSTGRMKSDAIFRDAALHFLRRFDEVLTDVEPRMSDEQVARFATTRTARAFMLLGRVAGTFD